MLTLPSVLQQSPPLSHSGSSGSSSSAPSSADGDNARQTPFSLRRATPRRGTIPLPTSMATRRRPGTGTTRRMGITSTVTREPPVVTITTRNRRCQRRIPSLPRRCITRDSTRMPRPRVPLRTGTIRTVVETGMHRLLGRRRMGTTSDCRWGVAVGRFGQGLACSMRLGTVSIS